MTTPRKKAEPKPEVPPNPPGVPLVSSVDALIEQSQHDAPKEPKKKGL